MSVYLVLGVLIDAWTDPYFAKWTDGFISKNGRRKPFMYVFAFICPVVQILAYTPP